MHENMTTPASNPNAPHAFKTSSGPAYLRDHTGTLVTEARFQQHHRVLVGIANTLAEKRFGWETLTYTLEPVAPAPAFDYADFEARR